MFKNIITTITAKHFWRTASFSEIGNLHMARLMRIIAINLGAALMSVYMLKIGYSIVFISLFWAAYFIFKSIIMLPLAQLIATIGARKSILVSNILYIPSMISLIYLPEYGMSMLIVNLTFQAVSATLYDLGYLVGLSRLTRGGDAGREVAKMNIAEKIARGLSPLIGGLVAMFFDPRASIIASIVFFIIASWPLVYTIDSMTTGFKLAPSGFPWRKTLRSVLVQVPMGFDYYASTTAWSLFLAVIIFNSTGNQIYAELGAITSLILLISLISAYAYGRLIDRKAGGQLLIWTAMGNVAANLFRVFVRTPVAAIGTNAVHEVVSTGYSMAYTRGMLDIANNTGYRVFYIAMTQLASNLGAGLGALLLAIAIWPLGTADGFTVFYVATAVIVVGIGFVRFSVYKNAP